MNDRLGDLSEVPSWAQEPGGDNDIEEGFNATSTTQPLAPQNNPFDNESVDEADDFGWASETDDNNVTNSGNEQDILQQQYMDAFYKDIEKIRADIEAIEETTKRIGDMNDKAVSVVSDREEAELSRELTPLIQETNNGAKRTKNMLELLKEENAKFKKEKTVKDSDMRIRENLCNTLTRKFIDEMKLYQSTQQKYKTDLKDKAVRQIKLIKPEATPDEVDTIMKSDGGRTELMQQTVLAGGVNESIKQAYTNVAGKYQDVIALEQSVAELHQMFLDFALLTEQQGELIDQIEHNVKSAADYVEEGNVEFHKGIEYQKSIRKKQCWIIILVLILTVILLFAFRVIP